MDGHEFTALQPELPPLGAAWASLRPTLFAAPVLLVTGTPLLDPAGPTVRLTLRDSETWPGGSLRARYAVPAAKPTP